MNYLFDSPIEFNFLKFFILLAVMLHSSELIEMVWKRKKVFCPRMFFFNVSIVLFICWTVRKFLLLMSELLVHWFFSQVFKGDRQYFPMRSGGLKRKAMLEMIYNYQWIETKYLEKSEENKRYLDITKFWKWRHRLDKMMKSMNSARMPEALCTRPC